MNAFTLTHLSTFHIRPYGLHAVYVGVGDGVMSDSRGVCPQSALAVEICFYRRAQLSSLVFSEHVVHA